MTSEQKKNRKNLDYQILVTKYLIYTKKQVTDELKKSNDETKKKMKKHESYFEEINTLLKLVIVQNQTSSPENMD